MFLRLDDERMEHTIDTGRTIMARRLVDTPTAMSLLPDNAKKRQYLLWGFGVWDAACGVVQIVLSLTQCTPIERLWNPTVAGACPRQLHAGNWSYFQGGSYSQQQSCPRLLTTTSHCRRLRPNPRPLAHLHRLEPANNLQGKARLLRPNGRRCAPRRSKRSPHRPPPHPHHLQGHHL